MPLRWSLWSRRSVLAGLAGAVSLPVAAADEPLPPLQEAVDEALAGSRLPAIGAVRIAGAEIEAIAVAGRRSISADAAVTPEDPWHLGSNTKSMTATLIARLVERGALAWDMTLGDALPRLAAGMHPDVARATLVQLLAHRAGLTPNPTVLWMLAGHQDGADPVEQRGRIVAEILAEPPEAAPGSKEIYSNLGYMVAGVIAQEAGGAPWEDLLRAEVFAPLGLTGAGFGAPRGPDQPRGHRPGWLVPYADVPPGPGDDNPAFMGPAGTVHMRLADWGRYLIDHLKGADGGGVLLGADTYRRLHTPVEGGAEGYALGWVVTRARWSQTPVIAHNGSNTMWFAIMAGDPLTGRGILVAANAGGDEAQQTLLKLSRRAMGAPG